MTYVAANGPPDIDATHLWTPASGASPPTLNNQGTALPHVMPWIKVRSIDGWGDMPEIVDNRAPRTFGEGEVAYPSRVLGKTLVYNCEVRGLTAEEARGTLRLCLAGFWRSRDDEGVMTVTPYAARGGPVFTFGARVIGMDSDSVWTYRSGAYGPYRWPFTVSLRMSDPLFYTGGTGYV